MKVVARISGRRRRKTGRRRRRSHTNDDFNRRTSSNQNNPAVDELPISRPIHHRETCPSKDSYTNSSKTRRVVTSRLLARLIGRTVHYTLAGAAVHGRLCVCITFRHCAIDVAETFIGTTIAFVFTAGTAQEYSALVFGGWGGGDEASEGYHDDR